MKHNVAKSLSALFEGIGLLLLLLIGVMGGFLLSRLLSTGKWDLEEDTIPYQNSAPLTQINTVHTPDSSPSVAEKLQKEVRILCWVMTSPSNHQKKAIHVKRTWGKRCNKLIFMSTAKDEELDAVALPIGEGRNNLWGKTKEAYKYIFKHHINDADWFLKADDDTYTIVENLRYKLYPYNPETPVYFGCKFKPFVKQGYMSGGAGYVLSREAVRRFVVEAIPDPKKCKSDNTGAEDVEMGICLENVKVLAGDSRDSNGRRCFFPLNAEFHLKPLHEDKTMWYWSYIYYKSKEGLDGCSDNAISFHYVSPDQMYVLEYFIYHLRPIGVVYAPVALPNKLAAGDLMPPPPKKLVKSSSATLSRTHRDGQINVATANKQAGDSVKSQTKQ